MDFSTLLLYADNGSRTFIIVLLCVVLFFSLFVGGLLVQWRERKQMTRELNHLQSMRKHGVEHELVLKALHLATWRYDVETNVVSLETDYRSRTDLWVPGIGASLDDFYDMVHSDDVERIREALRDLISGRSDTYHQQYRMTLSENDREHWMEDYATISERDDKGKPVVIVGTTTCIDEVKEMELALIDARNKAEESDRLKTAFIDNISHEVRTPLNAIVGFSDILPTVSDAQERDGLIAIIKENNQKLLKIFEEMMTISKAESHDVKLNVSDFSLMEMLQGLTDEFVGNNVNPEIEIKLQPYEDKILLHTDYAKLREVVYNFLSNAVKFTSHGRVVLSVIDDKDNHVLINCSDTGKGIPETAYERIFDRFVKLDDFVQGAGLGLSVCRSYAYSLGGTVGVKSKEGVGSTFWINIPKIIQ